MTTIENITFGRKKYNPDVLQKMSNDALLELRNVVASNLGVAKVNNFKDAKAAVNQTWAALQKWNKSDTDNLASNKTKPAKAPKEPAPPPPPAKCAFVKEVKRPNRGMFRKLKKIAEHPGKGHRIRRWENYKDGMTLLECHEGDETTPLDIGYYVDKKLMSLTDPTDQEFEDGVTAWYKRHGLENPAEKAAKAKAAREEAKAEKAAEREKAKADRQAKKEAAAKAREEAKAAKAKARADAKAKAA